MRGRGGMGRGRGGEDVVGDSVVMNEEIAVIGGGKGELRHVGGKKQREWGRYKGGVMGRG